MKMSDLPPRSMAAKRLRSLGSQRRAERLRCAQAALDMALWTHKTYPDEPAQWIRAEQILKDILDDNLARIEWWLKPSVQGGGER